MVAPRRILVIDDDAAVRRSCKRILNGEGYEVETVATGRDGLDRAVKRDIDLVVTDLRLPDLDGMEVVRTLRTRRPDVVVVIITGYGTVNSAVEAVKLGVSEYVEKPFTPEELSEAVSGALTGDVETSTAQIDAELVRQVLLRAARDQSFGVKLLTVGSRVLSGLPLSSEAKAAIVSGDIVWIEKTCGELSPEERDWLERRLEAEIW